MGWTSDWTFDGTVEILLVFPNLGLHGELLVQAKTALPSHEHASKRRRHAIHKEHLTTRLTNNPLLGESPRGQIQD